VNGSGVKKIGETFYFTPSNSSPGEQLFSYAFGGREVQLVAKVMTRPQARFSYEVKEFAAGEDGIAAAAIVQFTNLSVDAAEYQWDFGDGITSVEDSPTHTFDLAVQNTFKVTLTAMVEACRDQTDQKLSLVPIEFYIEKHIAEFCIADTTAYNLITKPEDGGEFVAHPAIDPAARTFHPDRVDLQGQKKAGVQLAYEVDQQRATLALDVYARPQPKFSTEILESDAQRIFVRFVNQTVDGSGYTWDFGDGATSNRPDPTHEYKISEESDFTVVLTAANGPCRASIQETLSLTPLSLKFGADSGRLFCENDEAGVELIGTPTGGVFSGPGVKDNRFIPALVDMGKLSKKTVTLQYTLGLRSATLLAEVYKYPVLGFTHRVTATPRGVTVSFTNQSINAETYAWDFGDGSAETTGYSISHTYKSPGVYQVTLKGINPPCGAVSLPKTVVAKVEDVQKPEIVPLQPLKMLNEMLKLSRVQGLLKEFGVNGASLADLYRQITEIVATGKDEVIAGFAKDQAWFIGPAGEIIKLGENMYRYGRGLQEAQLAQVIGLYRLSIGNIMNLLGKRDTDLGDKAEFYLQLLKLVKQAEELGPHLGFEKIQTDGFELVPQSWFDDLPNLQRLHIAFGKLL